MHRAAELLKKARSVVVAAHVDPDGDAIGSMLGLAHALDRIGVPTTAVLANGRRPPVTYAFLPGAERLRPPDQAEAPQVFVALDTPNADRLGDAARLARAAETVIAIDHHPDACLEATVQVFDSSAAATGALVWELLEPLGCPPDPEIATCLYAALLSDTGRFSYSNTTPAALRAAADMIEAGADPNRVYAAIYENRSPGAHALVVRTLERASFAHGGQVVYSWIDAQDFAETGAVPEEAENLIDHLRPLRGVRVVCLAKVDGNRVRVSLRAKGADDVGAIARQFGGGGHAAAAGYTVEGTLDEAMASLLARLPGEDS
jgi:phosphoesterase RecJ-like protein